MANGRKGDRIGDPRDKDARVRDYEAGQGRERGSIGTDRGDTTGRRGEAGTDAGRRGVAGREGTARRTGPPPRRGRRRLLLGLLALLIVLGGIALIASAGLLNQPQAPAPPAQEQQGQGQPPPNQQAAGEPGSNGQNQSGNQSSSVDMETTT